MQWGWGLLFVALVTTGAQAQRTGGSFGASDFGSARTSRERGFESSGIQSSGVDRRDDLGGVARESDGWGALGGSSGGSLPMVLFGLCFLGVAWLVKRTSDSLRLRRLAREIERLEGAAPAPEPPLDVTALSIAIAPPEAASVRREIASMANRSVTPHETFRNVHATLQRTRRAWVAVGIVDHRPSAPATADAFFQRLVAGLRTRVDPEAAGRPDALVVVSLVIASRTEIPDFGERVDAQAVATLLAELRRINRFHFVAVEVVTTDASDRAELLRRHESMVWLDAR